MNYILFERALSPAILSRYLAACKGNRRKAIRLYRMNIKLSQSFFGLIGVFEITLRNTIDSHYRDTLVDNEWLWHSAMSTGMFSNVVFTRGNYETRRKIKTARKSLLKPYTHDRLLAALSFGFWIKLFDRIQFRVGGQSLHRIFPNRPPGTNQKTIYKSICKLRDFRNRIAHHEPICFNNAHEKDLTFVHDHYKIIREMTHWLGYNPNVLYRRINKVNNNIRRIKMI